MRTATHTSIVVAAALTACEAMPPDPEGRAEMWSLADGPVGAPPLGTHGGTVYRGRDAQVTVTNAPPFSRVDLYLSRQGEGPQDCTTVAPTCLDLAAAQLYASKPASRQGDAAFRIFSSDFPETGEIAWQAVATAAAGAETIGDSIVRHVAVAAADADLGLVRATDEAGIAPLFTRGNTHTGGSAWFDYNNDLLPDLFVVNGSGRQNALYRNEGDGTFTHVPGAMDKPDLLLEPSGTKVADVDGDRDLDVFVSVDNPDVMIAYDPQDHEGGPNLLYLNEGNGSFVEAAEASGLVDPRGWRTSDAGFADFDRDGCIDVFAGNWAMAAMPANDNFSRLLRGHCDGTFTNVTADMGTDGDGRDTLVTYWWDSNNDLFPDLFLGNSSHQLALPDFDPTSNFYTNLDGLAFEDEVVARQPWLGLDAWAAMGADSGDLDLDGDWDLYVADNFYLGPVPRGNPLHLGDPDGRLTGNACAEAGVCAGYPTWAVNFADFNRDMWPDLWLGTAAGAESFLLYVNKQDGTFEHHEQLDFGPLPAQGGSVADYDGDGDVDVFVWVQGGESELYRNEPLDDHHWLEVKLHGVSSTWDAIGATVLAFVDDERLMRRVSGGDSAHSQSDSILHFGLGSADRVEELVVRWPSGVVQSFTDVPADDLVRIDEEEGLLVEELTPLGVRYVRRTGRLTVEVRSSWGGRSEVEVEGLGLLRFDAEVGRYARTFEQVPSNPVSITIRSRRGASVDVPVTVL